MDICRTLLLLGLVLLVWNVRFGSVRPVRDYVQWGILYPFHFLLVGVLILAVWGAVGNDFGIQGHFLVDDPLIQILVGGTVMLLLSALVLHYTLLDSPTPRRAALLTNLLEALSAMNEFLPGSVPVQRLLRNGFIERLDSRDLETVRHAIGQGPHESRPVEVIQGTPTAELRALLGRPPFRLLIAPAVLLVKGVVLVFLVGVVPVILVPLLNRDRAMLVDRSPWLLGVLLGDVLGIVLACLTTRWAAEAAGWNAYEIELLHAVHACRPPAAPTATTSGMGGDRPDAADPPRPDRAGDATALARRAGWPWVGFLLLFFTIHFVTNVVPPDSLTSRWIDWPEQTIIVAHPDAGIPRVMPRRMDTIPWLPMAVLAGEAACALVLLYGLSHARRHLAVRPMGRLPARPAIGRYVDGDNPRDAAVVQRSARTRAAGAAILLLPLIVVACFAFPALARSAAKGVPSLVSLGVFLAVWLAAFRLGTLRFDGRSARGWTSGFIAAAVVVLVLLYLTPVSRIFVAGLAATLATGAAVLGTPAIKYFRGSSSGRLVATSAMLAVLLISLEIGLRTSVLGLVASAWVAVAILSLGARLLGRVAREDPAFAYPLSLLLGFIVFALPYNALDPKEQAALPAAGSIACMIGLIAAVYTIIAFMRPKGRLTAALAVMVALVVLNGNAWFVDPNQFKATFPGMESYYARPVHLDSQDYFRDTTPSAVRLRNREVLERFDRLEKQDRSERLATAYFEMPERGHESGGGSLVTFRIEDERGRLRASVGDEVRLAAEEWYTTFVEGNDCIVLAEEPFYRKVFERFRYERLNMIRDGILLDDEHSLIPAGDPRLRDAAEHGRPRRMLAYETVRGPGKRRGLRLIDLAPEYRKNRAKYVLIAMSWSGRVTSARHDSHLDTYTVEFEIPEGTDAFDDDELKQLATWLDRCHLDVMRPTSTVDRSGVPGSSYPRPSSASLVTEGDCLVLEDARGESAIPIALYLAFKPDDFDRYPEFEGYRPSRGNLARAIRAASPPFLLRSGDPPPVDDRSFTLRSANDRGLFAAPARWLDETAAASRNTDPSSVRVAIYNATRLHRGDRLILSWGADGRDVGSLGGGLFEVHAIEERAAGDPKLPPGYRTVLLDRVSLHGPIPPLAAESGGRGLVVGEWRLLRPLNNEEVLLAWKKNVGGAWPDGKPKLVIVTVSGGGIRSSVWTSLVLSKLETTLGAEFPGHIRLITGASGGMVGGSYYATSLRMPPGIAGEGGAVDFATMHGVDEEKFVERMAADQLDSVAGRMVFADLLSVFNPFLQQGDRGKTLERTWIDLTVGTEVSPLARSLQSYAVDERLGRRPSMVYTPMMVEDGRRLLVSNLDMAFATRNVGGLLIEPSSRKIERPAFQEEDLDRSIHPEDEVFSLHAVEFARLFPEAHDFKVTTAIRMSASFPWVSPAISLPTLPPRRVVDAGYYDNYGVNLTALWLMKMRPWLEANTSGVIVVQIRDHVSQTARTEIDFDRVTSSTALDRLTWHADRELITPGLQAVSTPLLGMSNARQWTMSFRNDEQVDLLDLLFDDEKGRDFFRTVVFECPIEVSLNWKLNRREKDVLIRGFGHARSDPDRELARIVDYTIGRDAFHLHRWRIEHQQDADFHVVLKETYDKQLRVLGFLHTDQMTLLQSQELYENVLNNLKRLKLLRNWWRESSTR